MEQGQAELPGLVVSPGEDAVRAWARLPPGTQEAYVQFARGGDVPLGAVQRLARRGRIVVDAHPRDEDDVLDLAVAGAAAVVTWLEDGGSVEEMADAFGEGVVVGCPPSDAQRAGNLARKLGLPVLVLEGEPPAGTYGYRAKAEANSLALQKFGPWPDSAPTPTPAEGGTQGEPPASEGP